MKNLGINKKVLANIFSDPHKIKFFDIHYHASPDLYKRRYNATEVAKKYKSLQGAVVLKSHLGTTSVQASLLQKEGLPCVSLIGF